MEFKFSVMHVQHCLQAKEECKKRAAKIKGHIINLQSGTKTKNVKTKTERQDI